MTSSFTSNLKVGDKIYFRWGFDEHCRGKIKEIITDRNGKRHFRLTFWSDFCDGGWLSEERITSKRQ